MRGQIWSMDLIFAIVIFSFTILVVSITWVHISSGLTSSYGNSQDVMQIQAGTVSDRLLSVGSPSNWQDVITATNSVTWGGIAPGLASAAGQAQISPQKLYALMAMSGSNYPATKPLFGVGSNYYIVITSPGAGIGNITIGRNPLSYNASTIFVDRRSAVLDGNPVWVDVMLWSNSTSSAG
jgi:hypothetical protein